MRQVLIGMVLGGLLTGAGVAVAQSFDSQRFLESQVKLLEMQRQRQALERLDQTFRSPCP